MLIQEQIGVFIIDIQTKAVIDANPVALTMMGASKDKVIGRAYSECVSPADGSETFLIRTDRKKIPIIKSSIEIALGGKRYGVESFVDITEHISLEDKVRQANEGLKKLERLKSNFIATVSHELRIPLSVMKEGISLILDGVAGKTEEERKKILSTVSSNINRLVKIVSDLLDISKIEAGRMEVRRTFTDISGIVKEACLKWKPEADKNSLDLSVSVPTSPVKVYIDEAKIVQVLSSLLSNAVKFTPAGGKIKVKLKDGVDGIEIMVSDDGMGIAEDDIPLVFGKFQQFSRFEGRGPQGTGLSLAIARELVRMHGGAINLTSEIGKGSKFTVAIPKMDSGEMARERISYAVKESAQKNGYLSLVSVIADLPGDPKGGSDSEETKEFLKGIETAINESLYRRTDSVVGSGNEFVILLSDVTEKDALAIKSRIEKAIDNYRSHTKDESVKRIGFDIGCATFPTEAVDGDELLNKARKPRAKSR